MLRAFRHAYTLHRRLMHARAMRDEERARLMLEARLMPRYAAATFESGARTIATLR